MTNKQSLLLNLKNNVEEFKMSTEKEFDKNANLYAETQVKMIFGQLGEEEMTRAEVLIEATQIQGAILSAAIRATEVVLEELDEKINALNEVEKADDSEELTEEDFEIIAKAIREIVESNKNK